MHWPVHSCNKCRYLSHCSKKKWLLFLIRKCIMFICVNSSTRIYVSSYQFHLFIHIYKTISKRCTTGSMLKKDQTERQQGLGDFCTLHTLATFAIHPCLYSYRILYNIYFTVIHLTPLMEKSTSLNWFYSRWGF